MKKVCQDKVHLGLFLEMMLQMVQRRTKRLVFWIFKLSEKALNEIQKYLNERKISLVIKTSTKAKEKDFDIYPR